MMEIELVLNLIGKLCNDREHERGVLAWFEGVYF